MNLLTAIFNETFRLYYEVSPYLIIGFLFAGLLHGVVGEAQVKKHFSSGGIWTTIKATLLGVPLPVCSCGVIPLAESLHKDGASKSSTMSFLVSTPSTGIDSFFATYALLGPIYAFFRPVASFLSGVFIGTLTFFSESKEKKVADKKNFNNDNRYRDKSFKGAMAYGFKVLPAEIAKWLVIGVLVGGAISAIVPNDFAVRYLHSPLLNYLAIILISVPVYVCATGSIPIAATFLAKGMLPGAVLAFLIAGPATNTLTIAFVIKRMGKKIAALYIGGIVFVSIVLGILFDILVKNIGMEPGQLAGHMKFIPFPAKILAAIVLTGMLINSKYSLLGLLKKREMKMIVSVADMNCQQCKIKIENSLSELTGVKLISFDLKRRRIHLDTDLSRETVMRKIVDAGYHPS